MARWSLISSNRSLVLAVAVIAAGSGFAGGQAKAATGAAFLPHQALYELRLVKSRGSNAISSARGRILYSFSGSGCEGYTSEFRQVSELNSGEDKVTLSDLRSTSWEDGEGKSYRFKIDTRTNDTDSSPVEGVAERTGDRITVNLKQPETKTFTIDGSTVFPTEQIQRIIAAAKDGKSVLELTVYDGSDNGEKVYNTLTVIGQPIPGDRTIASPDPATTNDQMKLLTRWPRPRKASRRRSTRWRSNCSRTASRGRWCSTIMILLLPACWASSTSRIPSLVSEASAVIASEAKQSMSPRGRKMHCFVACAPLRKRFAFVAGNDGGEVARATPPSPAPHRLCP
jgi:hypothetical protein